MVTNVRNDTQDDERLHRANDVASVEDAQVTSSSQLRRQRILCSIAVVLNCLTSGAIFTFPLFAPPLARSLNLSGAQTNALASASILGEYISAVLFGFLTDKSGPGATSFAGAILFGLGYGMLGWRYIVSERLTRQGIELPSGQWIFLCGYYFLAGCGTAASYFSAIIAATKSTPTRHSGLAIGLPCSIFGLSPLFLSSLAPFFTSPPINPLMTGVNDELDPGKWLLFLAGFLFLINVFGGFTLKEIPWEEEDEKILDISNTDEETADERTRLLDSVERVNSERRKKLKSKQSFIGLLSTPTFWLFGAVIFLSTGPCEMVMASLGGIVESLLGVHTLSPPTTSSKIVLALVSSASTKPGASDPRALALRRLHVQVLSIANTISRLLIGFLSDWLSYSAAPLVPESNTSSSSSSLNLLNDPQPHRHRQSNFHNFKRHLQLIFHKRPPFQISRLSFLVLSCSILAITFFWASRALIDPSQLLILTISIGSCYGLIFTLAPAIVRTIYPVGEFGRNWGVLTLFSAFGASLFTPLFGIFLDRQQKIQRIGNGGGICLGRECFEEIFRWSGWSQLIAVGLVIGIWRGPWRGKV